VNDPPLALAAVLAAASDVLQVGKIRRPVETSEMRL